MTKSRIEPIALVLLAILLAACGPQEPAKNPRFDLKRPSAASVRQLTLSGPEALPGVVVAELASEDTEVHFARNGNKGVIVARAGGEWASGPIRIQKDAEDAVEDDPQMVAIAPAPAQRGPVALRAHGGGFVFVWAKPVNAGHEIWAAALDAKGVLVGKPRSAGRAFENVTFVDALSSQNHPTTLLWETTDNGKQTVFAATLPRAAESPGKLGAVAALTRDAIGWQATTGPAGTALAWVDGEPGRVQTLTLGKGGEASTPITLTQGATALSDVHVTALADRFVVGWTDLSAGDHHVHVAAIDGAAKLVSTAAPVLHPVGGQVLVALIAAQDRQRVLVAWERDLGVAMSPRKIELSLLDTSADLLPDRAELDFHSSEGTPFLVADGAGFTALTMAPMEQREAKRATPVLGPVFVRFSQSLAARSAEPIRVAELKHQAVGMEGVPRLVEGLNCDGGVCSLLATGDGTPALMALVSLPVRASVWRTPARKRPVATPPLVSELTTLADVDEPIADVASAVLADGRTLVAWVTHAIGPGEPQKDGEPEPATATLAFRFIDKGQPGPVHTLSTRAISVGGVAVLALPDGLVRDAVALIGWSGPSNGPQVYASLIDKQGGKARQKTVTQIVRGAKKGGAPNEVYDVDVAHDGHDNFVFAWSDSRDQNPEIYVARISPQLQKNVRDQRITHNDGPSIEPHLVASGGRMLLTWSDADADAAADVFVAELDGTTLAMNGKARRVEASPAHSRTPRWVGGVGSLALSWLDESTDEVPAAVRLMAVDDRGQGETAPRRIRTTSGTVTSRLVSCQKTTCRGVLAATDDKVLELAPFTTDRSSGAPVAAPVTNLLGGGTSQDLAMVSPDGSAGVVFFVHDRAGGARVRRMTVRW